MNLGEFGQRCEVCFDVLVRSRSRVPGNVVRAGENHYNLRLKTDDVLPEANEHLRGRLSSDAAVDVRLPGKELVEAPQIGDRIAEEHDTLLVCRRHLQCGVGGTISRAFSIVVRVHGDARCPVSIQARKSSRRNCCWRWRVLGLSGNCRTEHRQ